MVGANSIVIANNLRNSSEGVVIFAIVLILVSCIILGYLILKDIRLARKNK